MPSWNIKKTTTGFLAELREDFGLVAHFHKAKAEDLAVVTASYVDYAAANGREVPAAPSAEEIKAVDQPEDPTQGAESSSTDAASSQPSESSAADVPAEAPESASVAAEVPAEVPAAE